MMRSIERGVLALLFVLSGPARAADPAPPPDGAEPEVLISPAVRHGGWGGPVVQVSTVRERAAVFVGGRGGWIVDGRFTIGGGGFGLTSRIPAPPAAERPGEELELRMGYGGGWLEYTFSPLRLVHVSVGALVGGGSLSLGWRDGGEDGSRSDGFFVAEPAVTAELNVARWVRADVGVAYRLVAGVDMAGLSTSDVAGASAVVALKFGRF